jgi:hypothetical protein
VVVFRHRVATGSAGLPGKDLRSGYLRAKKSRWPHGRRHRDSPAVAG